MAKLERTFSVDGSSGSVKDKGSTIPQWYDEGIDDYANWWKDSDDTYYFYSMKDNKVYIQFGQNAEGWASTIFIVQELDVSEDEQGDGSIKFDGQVNVEMVDSVVTEFAAAGVKAHTKVTLNGQTIKDSTGMTNKGSKLGGTKSVDISDTIDPQETYTRTRLKFQNSYPNGEYENTSFEIGLTLENPNLPQYIPMAIRLDDEWEELGKGLKMPDSQKDNSDGKSDGKSDGNSDGNSNSNSDSNSDGNSDDKNNDPNIKKNYNLYNIAFTKDDELMQPYDPNGTNPDYPFDRPHMGVDTYMTNENLYALTNGTAYTFNDPNPSSQGGSGYGNHIILVGDDGYQYMFGHLQSFAIDNNTKVKVGDLLGVTGDTGDSTAPHLHFEVRQGANVDLSYGGTGEVINPLTWREEIFGF